MNYFKKAKLGGKQDKVVTVCHKETLSNKIWTKAKEDERIW